MQAGTQLALPFRRQGFSRPAPPPVMRRLAEGHRGVAATGYRRQETRTFDGVTQSDPDRNIPHEFLQATQTHPGILEIFAAHMGSGNAMESNQFKETTPGNRQCTVVDEIGAAQNLANYRPEGDQGDQNKPYSIEMQDLSNEASKSEAAACSTSHIISKRQPAGSEDK